ncbi:MAG TPA: divalent cation tolerance protein CutA, partial [Candidatus Polarisedimenticolia bacterium]|nr:divalent cation tolerance protein CutA [Candidatus Polarisedimenticolia bacterium]
VRSIYRWKDKVWNETEQLMVIKTTAAALEDVKRTVKELHSYELPDILALPITGGDAKAIAWIGASVKASRDGA